MKIKYLGGGQSTGAAADDDQIVVVGALRRGRGGRRLGLGQKELQAAALIGLQGFVAAADVRTADEHARHRLLARFGDQCVLNRRAVLCWCVRSKIARKRNCLVRFLERIHSRRKRECFSWVLSLEMVTLALGLSLML